MTQAKALRVSFAAVFTCGLLVGLVTLPLAALPIAYIGLTTGLTAAALTAGLASVLLGALAGPLTSLTTGDRRESFQLFGYPFGAVMACWNLLTLTI